MEFRDGKGTRLTRSYKYLSKKEESKNQSRECTYDHSHKLYIVTGTSRSWGERLLWRFSIKKQVPWKKVITENIGFQKKAAGQKISLRFFMEVWEKFGGKYGSFFLTLVVCIEIHISAHLQNFFSDVDDNDAASIANKLASAI